MRRQQASIEPHLVCWAMHDESHLPINHKQVSSRERIVQQRTRLLETPRHSAGVQRNAQTIWSVRLQAIGITRVGTKGILNQERAHQKQYQCRYRRKLEECRNHLSLLFVRLCLSRGGGTARETCLPSLSPCSLSLSGLIR